MVSPSVSSAGWCLSSVWPSMCTARQLYLDCGPHPSEERRLPQFRGILWVRVTGVRKLVQLLSTVRWTWDTSEKISPSAQWPITKYPQDIIYRDRKARTCTCDEQWKKTRQLRGSSPPAPGGCDGVLNETQTDGPLQRKLLSQKWNNVITLYVF